MRTRTRVAVVAAIAAATVTAGAATASADPIQDITGSPLVTETVGVVINQAGQALTALTANDLTGLLFGLTP